MAQGTPITPCVAPLLRGADVAARRPYLLMSSVMLGGSSKDETSDVTAGNNHKRRHAYYQEYCAQIRGGAQGNANAGSECDIRGNAQGALWEQRQRRARKNPASHLTTPTPAPPALAKLAAVSRCSLTAVGRVHESPSADPQVQVASDGLAVAGQ
jgi:hypothetical protein